MLFRPRGGIAVKERRLHPRLCFERPGSHGFQSPRFLPILKHRHPQLYHAYEGSKDPGSAGGQQEPAELKVSKFPQDARQSTGAAAAVAVVVLIGSMAAYRAR